MAKLFEAVFGGILSGSIYGLMALGLTLIWGALRMLNLAHGSLYLVGGYLAWTLTAKLSLPLFPPSCSLWSEQAWSGLSCRWPF